MAEKMPAAHDTDKIEPVAEKIGDKSTKESRLPFEIHEKKPEMDITPFYFSLDTFEEKILSAELEGKMFYTFFEDHFVCDSGDEDGYRFNEKTTIKHIPHDKLNDVFRCVCDEKMDYVDKSFSYDSYTEEFPVLKERTATYAIIFVDRGRVVYSIGSTYKYEEWPDLFEDMTLPGSICGTRGIHEAFVLYTDTGNDFPIFTLYDKAVAGFAVDADRKKLTAFPAESAVLIFHTLFLLSSVQHDRFFYQPNELREQYIPDDRDALSDKDINVVEFRKRLGDFQDRYDERKLVKVLTRWQL